MNPKDYILYKHTDGQTYAVHKDYIIDGKVSQETIDMIRADAAKMEYGKGTK